MTDQMAALGMFSENQDVRHHERKNTEEIWGRMY